MLRAGGIEAGLSNASRRLDNPFGAYHAFESPVTTEGPEWNGQRLMFGTEESVTATPTGLNYFLDRARRSCT